VARLDVFGGVQVGNRARYFQDAIVRAGGKAQARDRVLQQLSPSGEMAENLRIILGIICALE
jgi:hypothetical protein